MDYGDYLRQLDEDIRDLLAAMAKTDLTTSVPSCPGWSLGDLAFHLAEGYQHKIAAIRSDSRPIRGRRNHQVLSGALLCSSSSNPAL